MNCCNAPTPALAPIFARDLRCDGLTMRHLLSHRVNGAPGERFSYNPILYSWASRPMAAAAGKPFSKLVDEYVFRPAGMTRSARILFDFGNAVVLIPQIQCN